MSRIWSLCVTPTDMTKALWDVYSFGRPAEECKIKDIACALQDGCGGCPADSGWYCREISLEELAAWLEGSGR